MPLNGEMNEKFGVYRSVCCGLEIVIAGGSFFPDCPNHPNRTTEWNTVPDELTLPKTETDSGHNAA
jgi:hypothetical protein